MAAFKSGNRLTRKAPLNLKTTEELRAKIEGSAAQSGRTMTEEVERRIELSYVWEEAHGSVEQMKREIERRLADADLDAHKSDEDNHAMLSARLGWKWVALPNGRRVFLDPNQIGQLGDRVQDPDEVLAYLAEGAVAGSSVKSALVEALRETLRPDLLKDGETTPAELAAAPRSRRRRSE